MVDGIALAPSVPVTLDIRSITTSFLGRTAVDDSLQTPLAGVTVKFLGKDGSGNLTGCTAQTVSDGAGNFALTDLAPSCIGTQMIAYDRLTATSPPGKYAGVNRTYTLATNQVTSSPAPVHLPRIVDKNTIMVRQSAPEEQTYAFRTVPGLS